MQEVNKYLGKVDGGSTLYDEKVDLYTVKAGDTIQSIAMQFNTKVGVVLELNPKVQATNIIRPGQQLLVPSK